MVSSSPLGSFSLDFNPSFSKSGPHCITLVQGNPTVGFPLSFSAFPSLAGYRVTPPPLILILKSLTFCKTAFQTSLWRHHEVRLLARVLACRKVCSRHHHLWGLWLPIYSGVQGLDFQGFYLCLLGASQRCTEIDSVFVASQEVGIFANYKSIKVTS